MSLLRLITKCLLICFILTGVASAASDYAGSKTCAKCHEKIYSDWRASGHHTQLRKASEAQHANLTPPPGYKWEDLSYVIGGFNKKTLFLDQKGYLITSAKDGSKAKTQYNLTSKTWSYYFPGERKTYDCAYCHTTGYRPEGRQAGLEGIVGTWEEDGIGCESCHGPSRAHAEAPRKKVNPASNSSEICESCHQRGGIDRRPLNDFGLIRHHEQINELKAGPHKGLSCLNCHNPHRRANEAKYNCTICHSRLYNKFLGSVHGQAEIKCFECHMPIVSKSAISRVSYIGEVRTHLFKINVDPDANMFRTIKENGKESTFTKPFVTVDFVCLGCHDSRDKAWAAKHAKGMHD